MRQYTNYEFYKDTYKGNMPEFDFDRLIIKSSYEVQKNIFNRDIKNYEDEIQMATCSVVDIFYKIEQIQERKSKLVSSSNIDKVLASETVGDLSRTFANTNKLSELDEEISNLKNKIKEEIRMYLLDTGLLYRGT